MCDLLTGCPYEAASDAFRSVLRELAHTEQDESRSIEIPDGGLSAIGTASKNLTGGK